MRKIIFLFSACATLYLAGFFRSGPLMILFFAELFLFIGMFIVSKLIGRRLSFDVLLSDKKVKKGEYTTGCIKIKNKSLLAVTKFELSVVCKTNGVSDNKKHTLKGYVGARSVTDIEVQLSSIYSGILSVELGQIKVWDYLGFFASKKKLSGGGTFVVMPSQNKIDIRKNQIFLGFDNLDREAVNRPGNQPPEIYQIKTYTPGDSIRNIHWKLTARMDELMSKEYMDEVGTELFFFIDLRSSDSSPKKLDAFWEIISAISLGFLSSDIPHCIQWFSVEEKQTVSHNIKKYENYSEMIESLIITGVIDGTKTVSEEYMSEFYQHCMKNESVLMFNTDLILSYNENIIKEFSEEDYEQEIKKSTICI